MIEVTLSTSRYAGPLPTCRRVSAAPAAPLPPPVVVPPTTSTSVSNPVTLALTGTRTFNVSTDAELDAVPFASLQPGDVVNVYHRADPYRRLVRVRTSGTAAAPIRIHGVTDAQGNRPVFSGDGARVAAGCLPGCFSTTNPDSWPHREAVGLIATAIGPADDYNTRPKWVNFSNLEITEVKHGKYFTDAREQQRAWSEASAWRVQDGEDITIENCVLHDNDYGIFTQANNSDALHAATRVTIRNNRVYGNGMVGRSTEHNIYLQAIDPVVEGNYVGPLRVGSQGSGLKSRSANAVIRFNWIESTARAVDIVHSEDSWTGVQAAPGYGSTYFYGNVLCNDWTRLGSGASYPMHVGGDNMGEDGAIGASTLRDANLTAGGQLRQYQKALYCWGNTFVFRSSSAQTWRASLFALSLSGTETQPRTTAYEWNNAYLLEGSTNWAKLLYAGQLVHGGGSIAQVTGTLANTHENADPSRWNIVGTLALGALGLTDYRVTATAPAGAPPTLPAGFRSELLAVSSQPRVLSNGTAPRSSTNVIGALQD